MTETELRFLRCLRNTQPYGLRRSLIPRSCHSLVQALQTIGAVAFLPAPTGRGVLLRVTDENAFQRFVSARLPSGLDVEVTRIADRAAAIAMLGDAKIVRRGVAQGVFIRSTMPDVELRAADGEALLVSQLTAQAGGAAIELSDTKSWTFSGSVLVIENADAFWQHQLVLPTVGLALLAAGHMSNRLISWLASSVMRDCQIIHWGDYDPVGVSEYVRLADACPGRVQPFAPGEVDKLLPRYGKRNLITEQARYFDQLRQHMHDAYVSRMVRLFDLHRRGLEQEILLHPAQAVS